MKIAVWHNLPSGGGKRALYDHVKGLLVRGHQVESWSPPTADLGFLPLSRIITEHVVDLEWPVQGDLLDRFGLTVGSKKSIAAMDLHCKACAKEIESGGFDLVFANSCYLFAVTSIGRFTRLPSILYLQEPYRALYEALPELWWTTRQSTEPETVVGSLKERIIGFRSFRSNSLRASYEYQNASAFSKILVNSYFSRESVLRAYGLEAEVCYLGVDTGVFFSAEGKRHDELVGVGQVSPHKNIGFCIEAVSLLQPPRPKLTWVGNVADKQYKDELVAKAADLGVPFEPRLNISEVDLVQLLNRAAVMVYAPRLEPFGFAPLEANACGLPVVAVREGGVRETILDQVNGILVNSKPDEMARAIKLLLASPSLARRLGANGRKLVEDAWGLEKSADRIEAKLLECVS